MNRHHMARGALAAAGVLATLLLTACGGLTGTPAASGGGNTTNSTASNGSTGSTGGTGGVPVSPGSGGTGAGSLSGPTKSPAKTAECKSTSLKVSLGQSDGAAGHVYQALEFTNIGTTSCVIVGFPGVSYVTGDNGTQVGQPAQRDGAIGAQITLAPGKVASAIVTMTDVGVFDPAVCQPTPTRGLRVYPPDETRSVFVAQTGTGCAGNPPEPQLRVQTIKAGPGNP